MFGVQRETFVKNRKKPINRRSEHDGVATLRVYSSASLSTADNQVVDASDIRDNVT